MTVTDSGSTPGVVSEQDIADVVKEILLADRGPHLLSTLGNILSDKFDKPIREILGETKLRTIVEKYLGNEVKFQGGNSRLEVKILPIEPNRYNRKFWTAFSKPVLTGTERWIDPVYPFNFHDYPVGDKPPHGHLHIDSGLIPAPEIPKDDRDAKIREIIQAWCTDNKRTTFEFSASLEAKPTRRVIEIGQVDKRSQLTNNQNNENHKVSYRVDALIRFIDAIPEADRNKYSLPLDLIRRFVD